MHWTPSLSGCRATCRSDVLRRDTTRSIHDRHQGWNVDRLVGYPQSNQFVPLQQRVTAPFHDSAMRNTKEKSGERF